jgi:hypothetical protein
LNINNWQKYVPRPQLCYSTRAPTYNISRLEFRRYEAFSDNSTTGVIGSCLNATRQASLMSKRAMRVNVHAETLLPASFDFCCTLPQASYILGF